MRCARVCPSHTTTAPTIQLRFRFDDINKVLQIPRAHAILHMSKRRALRRARSATRMTILRRRLPHRRSRRRQRRSQRIHGWRMMLISVRILSFPAPLTKHRLVHPHSIRLSFTDRLKCELPLSMCVSSQQCVSMPMARVLALFTWSRQRWRVRRQR